MKKTILTGNKKEKAISALPLYSNYGGISGKRKPTHPGEVLKEDVLNPLGLTVTEAAKRLRVTRKTLSELLNC